MNEQRLEFLKQIRLHEIEIIASKLGEAEKLLEIGAGAGWQAAYLSNLGFQVEAVDIASSIYKEKQVFPVQVYDGRTLPFDDRMFDAIYSSTVLEHIPHLNEALKEMKRVLKDDGFCVHLVPSPTWRLLSNVAHYLELPVKLRNKLKDRANSNLEAFEVRQENSQQVLQTKTQKLWNQLLPPVHGERGNFITEAIYFRSVWWKSAFREAGFEVVDVQTNRLLYSGYSVFGKAISMDFRRFLSRILGSVTLVYLLRKKS